MEVQAQDHIQHLGSVGRDIPFHKMATLNLAAHAPGTRPWKHRRRTASTAWASTSPST